MNWFKLCGLMSLTYKLTPIQIGGYRAVLRLIWVIVLCSAATACATSPGRFSDTPETLDEAAFAELLGALSPQQLTKGQCGLFLWKRDQERDLVFFDGGRRSEGKMMIAGQETAFQRQSAEGDPFFGQYPQQVYQKGDMTVTLSLEIQPRSNMAGGAIVSRGSLRFEQTGGWNLVVPVGGLVACQPST